MTIKYFIGIIKAVLNGTEFNPQTEEAVDFEQLYAFAKVHQLAGVLGFCPEALAQMPVEIAKNLLYEKNRSISREAVQETVISAFLDKMEDMGLRALLLKGFCIKNMYPHPAIRHMTDTDILIDEKDIEFIKPILEDLGLKYDHDTLHEVIFSNRQLAVELHKTLIPSNLGRLYDYYSDPWRFAVPQNGKKYICEMSPEDFYVFAVGHVAKHYAGGGIGIKHIMDIYILNKCEYDWDYINAELEKLGLSKFSELVGRLARSWFSESSTDKYDEDVWELGASILQSGAFGEGTKRTVSGIYRRRVRNDKSSKLKIALKGVFPSLEHMRLLYPPLRKHAFLYLAFWLVRAFDVVFNRRKELKTFKHLASAKQQDIDDFANQLKRVGIPEDL